MGLTEILALFRVGMKTWEDVANAIEALKDDGVTDELLADMRARGNDLSDALGESIHRREEGDD